MGDLLCIQWIDTNAEPKFQLLYRVSIVCAKCDVGESELGRGQEPGRELARTWT